jgi:hypothetical protein
VLIDPSYPMASAPDMVFVDGTALRQVAARADVVPGTFYVDTGANRLFIGNNPAGRTVEASTLIDALAFKNSPRSQLLGIGVRRFATPISKKAAVRGYSDDVMFENNWFVDNALVGLSVIGRSARVEHNTMQRNGQLGFHAHYADGLLLAGNVIGGNNVEHFVAAQSAGGAKITASRQVVVEANRVEDNLGNGVWIDVSAMYVKVLYNYLARNDRNGVMYELSAFGLIASNIAVDNDENGVYVLESNDVQVWNNTLLRNKRDIFVLEGSRTNQDLSYPGHDNRFPVPNPEVPWSIQRVTIRNNVLSDVNTGGTGLLVVDDSTHQRTAEQMQVTADYDAYHRSKATAPKFVSVWSRWPAGKLTSTTFAGFVNSTGQEAHGFAADNVANPYVADEAAFVFHMPAGAAAGKGLPLPADVATALHVAAGARISPGVLSPAEQAPTTTTTLAPTTTTTTLPPTVAIDDVTVTEGNVGTQDAVFGISLSKVGSAPVTVDIRTAAASATLDDDFLPTSATLTFEPGELTMTVGVPVVGDYDDEADETMTVELLNAANATISDPVDGHDPRRRRTPHGVGG